MTIAKKWRSSNFPPHPTVSFSYPCQLVAVADFTNVLETLSQDPMDSCSPLDEGYVRFSTKKQYEFIKNALKIEIFNCFQLKWHESFLNGT